MTLSLNNGLVLKFDLAEIMGHLHLNTMTTRTVHFLLFMMNPYPSLDSDIRILLNQDLFHLNDLLLGVVKNNDLVQVNLDLPNLKNPFVIPQH
jgi:hypothetical protein